MPKLCFSPIFFFFSWESDLFFFRDETDQKCTQSIIYFPEMTLASLHLWLSRLWEFLGNVLTVAILNWGAFQTAENLCISQACRLLLFCKRRPTPDGVYVTASENAAAPAAALPLLPSSPRRLAAASLLQACLRITLGISDLRLLPPPFPLKNYRV